MVAAGVARADPDAFRLKIATAIADPHALLIPPTPSSDSDV